MKRDETRLKLIDGAIKVVAKYGLDKASTKQIGITTSTNEAYIYRCFKDKDDMLVNVFNYLDKELLDNTMKYIDVMYMKSLEYKMRCRFYFSAVWEFLLENRDKCLAYVQYYYSPYFCRFSAEEHEKRFSPLVAKFKGAFRDEADVWMILNHILNVMLDFAVKVHNGHMTKENDYAEHVFRVIYCSVEQYFRNENTNG